MVSVLLLKCTLHSRKYFLFRSLAKWLAETARDQTATETCDHVPLQLLGGRKADAAERRRTWWKQCLPGSSAESKLHKARHGGGSETSLCETDRTISPVPRITHLHRLCEQTPPARTQQQDQRERICQDNVCHGPQRFGPECPLAVPWSIAPSLGQDTLPGAILTRDTAPGPGAAPSSASWLPLCKPSSAQGKGCGKQRGVLQKEGVWNTAESTGIFYFTQINKARWFSNRRQFRTLDCHAMRMPHHVQARCKLWVISHWYHLYLFLANICITSKFP